MKDDIKALKEALRILDARYVMSEMYQDYALIRFNYKDKNYILHINYEYKFMMLEQTDSVKGISIDDDVIGLLDDIKTIKSYLELETYSILAAAVSKEMTEEGLDKRIEITKELNNIDIGMSYEILDSEEEVYHGNLIAYDCGLNSFDKRIFLDEWLEDFNEKVSTYQEEDIYILLSTLVSYFYKVEQNKWDGYTIDPFVVSDVIEMILSEIKRREKDFESWFGMWECYFTDENLEKYLSGKDEEKRKIKEKS